MKNKKKILIIEDEEVLLDVLQKKLTIQGYDVSEARDGEDGLKKINEAKPDLILLDLVMPKKDGFEVLAEMHKRQNLADIPVIIISNSGQPVEIDRALKLGAKDYLIKTEFDPDEVIGKVEKIFKEDSGNNDKISSLEKNEKSEEKKQNNPGGSGHKILIVEDDKFLRELIAKKLKGEGYEIVLALDGEEALKKVKKEKPSLILLDLILPGIDGFEVLRQIKKDSSPEINGISVLILSNLGQSDDIEKGMNLGAEDFLIKAHFTPAEIVAKIKQSLDKRK